MCQFINVLSKVNRATKSASKSSLELFIKPTKDKEYYRVRLLGFKSSSGGRTDPFIERYVHTHWSNADENGKRKIDDVVVCPTTSFVEWEGNRSQSCPICRYASANYGAWMNSGWKDIISRQNYKNYTRVFQGIIPCYVINDPVYPQNNGKFKVFIIKDKKFYDKLREYISNYNITVNPVFNDTAVDFYFRMDTVEKTSKNGFKFKVNEIVKYGFTKEPKTITAITEEALKNFSFDEDYYYASTMEELQGFYSKHICPPMDDIPEDDDIPEIPLSKPKPVETPKVAAKPINQNHIDDLISDDEDLPFEDEKPEKPIQAVNLQNTNTDKSDDLDIDVSDVDSLIEDCLK